jgi:hypothetical protein
MNDLIQAINKYAYDTENAEKNYNLALLYDKIGQTASAITYYLRGSERTEDKELSYECLIRLAHCFERQGNRRHTVIIMLMHAICLLPNRPEAYYLLSRIREKSSEYVEAYMLAQIALGVCYFNLPPLRTDVGYPGKWALVFEKAVSSWHWGKTQESKELFKHLSDNYMSVMPSDHRICVLQNLQKLGLDTKEQQEHRVVDCFPFFQEKELLELRVNLLKDHVDKFIITESNRTFSGIPKPFICKNLIKELGLPEDKIEVIEVSLPSNEEMTNVDHNLYQDPYAATREVLQKNAWRDAAQKFSDDTVFIFSDCDEIIDPTKIKYITDVARKNSSNIIKLPLVSIQGRADLITYKYGKPELVDNAALLCMKHHLATSAPIQLRHSLAPVNFETVYITESGKRVEDMGWHFSWMGNAELKKFKSKAFSHHSDEWEGFVFKKVGSKEMEDFIDSYVPQEGALAPFGQIGTELRKYDISKLPEIIFKLPRVKKFLFNE